MAMQQGQPQVQAPTVDRPNRWPLVIMPTNRSEDTSTDARLINGYMEKELQGDIWLYKRPGLQQLSRPAVGLAQGCYNWRGDVYVIVNGELYKNGTFIAGTINTTNGVYRFSSTMEGANATQNPPELIFQNGVKAYAYDDTHGLLDITGDIDDLIAPPWVKGWAYLDGTTYIMSPAAGIYGSEINTVWDPSPSIAWPAGNVIVAQIEPSRGIALAKQLVHVIAFKENSTEIFFDAGNAEGSPLGTVPGAKLNYGCISADSVRQLDGALFWLCTNESAAVQVMKMDNLKAEIVSSPAVERLLESADFTSVYSWTLKLGGHKWYAVTLVNNNLTLMFDLTTGLWSQWTDKNGNYLPIVDSTYNTTTAETILQHANNGWLYVVSTSQYTDDGDPITVDIYTPNNDSGTARDKTLQAVYFDTNQTPGSQLLVRHTDDDYQSWSSFRPVDLSIKKPMLQNEGTFKRRAYHLRHREPTFFRIKSMDLQLDIGDL